MKKNDFISSDNYKMLELYELNKSHAKFICNNYENKEKQQSSYNLPISIFNYFFKKEIIEKINFDNSKNQEEGTECVFYTLSSEYNFILGNNLLSLIGESFSTHDNKVIFALTTDVNGDKKFQLRRNDFNKKSKENKSYEWFVKLYDSMSVNFVFNTFLNEKDKKVKFDINVSEKFFQSLNTKKKLEKKDFKNSIIGGKNILFYGVPGSGKSYKIEEIVKNEDYLVNRITFHPDYSYSDFIGQIIPKTNGNSICYKFSPGPFSRTLLQAFENPNKKICLIIEEINRGNAHTIFGDIFQLLDRNSDGKSNYSIDNSDIYDFLIENNITNLEINKIYIPTNLWIYSTMNVSDQNVFTLDNAFKRRWEMEYVPNYFSENSETKIKKMYIPGSNWMWKDFLVKINQLILKNNNKFFGMISEDKQIGCYYVNENCLWNKSLDDEKKENSNFKKAFEKPKKLFAEKVLMYIWNDVSQINRSDWFIYETYNELIENFLKTEEDSLKVLKEFNQNDYGRE